MIYRVPHFGNGKIDGWNVLSIDKFYPGDFDGDGTEELFCVQGINNNGWAALLKFQDNDWDWMWSNAGNGWINNLNQGWGIRAGDIYYVGDFDGDLKDELLCVQTDGLYMTLLKYNNGNWEWQWSNNGDINIGNGIYPCKLKLVIGDFDKDNKDEVLGVNSSIISLYDFTNNWIKIWSNNGNISHILYPYRNNLRAGDFNGDGRTDLLGFATSATVFYYNPMLINKWYKGETTNGASYMGGWTYPPFSSDVCLIGNVDLYDNKDEIFWLQTGTIAGWATTMNAMNGSFCAGWTNGGNPPFIDDWSIANNSGNETRYLLIKPTTSPKKYLLAFRKFGCDNFFVNMYSTNSPSNYKSYDINDSINNNSNQDDYINIYPNPSSNSLNISLNYSGLNNVEVYNYLGVLQFKNSYNSESQTQLNISELKNGVYYLKVWDSEQRVSIRKFVINK